MENRIWRRVISEIRTGMNVNGVKPLMTFKEFFPQRSKRQWPSCQEHERYLRRPFERIRRRISPRRHGSSPQQLFVVHVMHCFRRFQIFAQPFSSPFHDGRRRRHRYRRRRRRRRRGLENGIGLEIQGDIPEIKTEGNTNGETEADEEEAD